MLPVAASPSAAPPARKSGPCLPFFGEIDADGVPRFLRAAYGKPAAAAAELGVSERTVEKWFSGETLPGFRATFLLIVRHGPDFLLAIAKPPPAWLSPEAARAERAEITRTVEDVIRRLRPLLVTRAPAPLALEVVR